MIILLYINFFLLSETKIKKYNIKDCSIKIKKLPWSTKEVNFLLGKIRPFPTNKKKTRQLEWAKEYKTIQKIRNFNRNVENLIN